MDAAPLIEPIVILARRRRFCFCRRCLSPALVMAVEGSCTDSRDTLETFAAVPTFAAAPNPHCPMTAT